MSPCIMGLTIQDPYILKEHTELCKILKFRVSWASIEQDTAIQKLKNLLTYVWIAGHLSGNPYCWRVRYIGNLYITNLRGNDQNVGYIEVS